MKSVLTAIAIMRIVETPKAQELGLPINFWEPASSTEIDLVGNHLKH